MNKSYLSLIILLIFSFGCAQWQVAPSYEPVGSVSGVGAKKIYVGKIEPTLVSAESDVNIVGFSIDPQSFLKKDIGKYLADAIREESEKTGIFLPLKSSIAADFEITGEVKEFYYKMSVEEIPMKGEGYAYYYKADFNLHVNCIVKQKSGGIMEKNYTSINEHATVYHTLTNWEKPFTEDLNIVIFEIVEELFSDIGKTFITHIEIK